MDALLWPAREVDVIMFLSAFLSLQLVRNYVGIVGVLTQVPLQ